MLDSQIPVTLKGFDLEEGLARLGGNKQLFLRLIYKFYDNYLDFPRKMSASLEGKDFDEARKLAHLIKGSSGNLGAMDLYDAASILEQALKKNELSEIDVLSNAFTATMQIMLESIESIQSVSSLNQEDNEIMRELSENMIIQGIDLIVNIKQLIGKNYALAVDNFSELLDLLQGTAFYEEARHAKGYLENFDETGAIACLNAIRDKIQS